MKKDYEIDMSILDGIIAKCEHAMVRPLTKKKEAEPLPVISDGEEEEQEEEEEEDELSNEDKEALMTMYRRLKGD